MANDIKVLLMTRHGVKGNTPETKNWLYPESIQRMNQNAGGYIRGIIRDLAINPGETFAYHSDQVRTRNTANAILSGAFGLEPAPQKQEDLASLEQRLIDAGLQMNMHQGLCYPADIGSRFNSALYAKDEPAYMDLWLANPTSETMGVDAEGKPVPNISFNEVYTKSRPALVDALGHLIDGRDGNLRLGVLATHGGLIEGLAIHAFESASDTPVTSFAQIGGYFPQEDYATIVIGPSSKTLIRASGKSYNLNLDKLLGASA